MSRQISNAFGRSLAIASTALLIHIGSAAAAAPHSDFQNQVSAVLAGTLARDGASTSSLRANSPRDEATDSNADAQQFAQRLLLGWNASHPGHAGSAARSHSTTASAVTQQPAEDIQITVQRFLQGQKTARSAS